MKLLLFLPVFFILASANQEVIEVDQKSFINALKGLGGSKFYLPKDLVDKLKELELEENVEKRALGITAIVDTYVDNVLEKVKKFIIKSGLDPTELEDATLNLIPTGTITLSSGWLQDISSIQRNGNSTVNYSASTRALELYLPLKFNALLVTYKYLTKILLLSINGDANGKIEDLTINLKLSYSYGTYQASLDSFDITDSGRFSLKFSGNDLVDWITNTMTTVVTFFVQPIVIRIVQAMIEGGLQNVVDAVNEFISSIFSPGSV